MDTKTAVLTGLVLLGGAEALSSDLSPAGDITAWLISPHYNQGYGANPSHANMARDYLTDGINVTEADIIPFDGMEVDTDYSPIGPAASTGAQCGTNATCIADPPTFFRVETGGQVNFNSLFGDIDNVMAYFVVYLTNHTAGDLLVRGSINPDDSAQVQLDQTTWYWFDGCCAWRDFEMIIPKGEHRLMVKIFEGGGGFNGWMRILAPATGQGFDESVLSASTVPTMTDVPPPYERPGYSITGEVTTWLISPHYTQTGGANPPNEVIALDYLTEGFEGGLTEATIIPVEGMEVDTDYAAAQSTGATCGTKADCVAIPPTWMLYEDTPVLDFNTIYGDQSNVMTYMVNYLTNTTKGPLFVRVSLLPDDAAQVLLDNTTVYFYNPGCCAVREFAMVIPPGEHRFMIKVFEGGGAHYAQVQIRDLRTGGTYLGGELEISAEPTMKEVPPPVPWEGLSPGGNVVTWLISPHYTQTGGANPPNAVMALDYLTEGFEGGLTEKNIIPEEGMQIDTDYTAAQSTGCTCGTRAGCDCSPPTWELIDDAFFLDFNTIYGDRSNVMTYMVNYLTNTTPDILRAIVSLNPDDNAQVLLDNNTVYFYNGCCAFQEFVMPISPGQHRFMIKIFEGGGGHNAQVRIRDSIAGLPYTDGELEVTAEPTMTKVPKGLKGLTLAGAMTTWLISPHYTQTGGANPSHAAMTLDYLTDGIDVTEANIIPKEGMEVETDYLVAASTGATCGTKADCVADPPTWMLFENTVLADFSVIFGDQSNVMTYMVNYLTNTTKAPLRAIVSLNPDDSAQVQLDDQTIYFYDGCCAFREFPMVIHPGEHRFMIKIFEGGGGHNGRVRIRDAITGFPYIDGELEVSGDPTITEVPEWPKLPGLSYAGDVTTWLISPHYRQPYGPNPSHDNMALDYLTDGFDVTEEDIMPEEGMEVETDYTVAASTGCICGSNLDCNCDPPTWQLIVEEGGLADFSVIFGDQSNVMTYMVNYLVNTTADPLETIVSLYPDDSAQVQLGDETVYFYDGCCAFREFPMTIPPGKHRFMIKIFEGGGGHYGQVRIRDAATGFPYIGGELEVTADPAEVPVGPLFKRGYVNGDVTLDLGDAITALNYMFAGGAKPPCEKAADMDDKLGLTIGDAIYLLSYLFADGPAPAAPFATCGLDPTPDDGLTCVRSPVCP